MFIFRIFDETLHCTQRFTFACSSEVASHVKQSVATSVCLGYDLFKYCPSVTKVTSVDLPKCMSEDKEMDDDRKDDMKEKDTTKADDKDTHMMEMEDDHSMCSLDRAMECVGMMYYELLGPFLDCSRFHRYVNMLENILSDVPRPRHILQNIPQHLLYVSQCLYVKLKLLFLVRLSKI